MACGVTVVGAPPSPTIRQMRVHVCLLAPSNCEYTVVKYKKATRGLFFVAVVVNVLRPPFLIPLHLRTSSSPKAALLPLTFLRIEISSTIQTVS